MAYPDLRVIKVFALQKEFGIVGPFRTTGGWLVPLYFDTRKVFSSPKNLRMFVRVFEECIKKNKIKFDVIVGGVTAGMPIALALALKLNKPFCYVRKEAKKGGLGVAAEGYYQKGWKALLIDDAIANGTSKIKFIKNIRKVGMKVNDILVTIRRPRKKSFPKLKGLGVKVYDFGTLDDIMEYMAEKNIMTREALQLMHWYTKYPNTWQDDPKKMAYFRKYKKMKKNSKSGI